MVTSTEHMQKALKIIDVCKTVLASPVKQDPPDVLTMLVAEEILKAAKGENREDAILSKINLENAGWARLLLAMEIVAQKLEK
jgi:hypothetical protein